MEGLDKFFDTLPPWLGTLPSWGIFILLCVAVVRTSPAWLTTWAQLRLAKSNENAQRIANLEQQVLDCIKDCDEHKKQAHKEIQGLRTQRNAEQLVIMRAIVSMSNDPVVKQQLELLEAMEVSLKQGAQNNGSEPL